MSARAWAILFIAGAIGVAGAHWLDPMGIDFFREREPTESKDWHRALRVMGYVPVWFVVGVLFYCVDRVRTTFDPPMRDRWTRAVLLWVSVLTAGALAEVLKLVIRRERPYFDVYTFRPYAQDLWSSSGIGMPSSHTAVAFGAVTMIGLLHGQGKMLLFTLAALCGLTRIAEEAHYVSDVALGAFVGIASAWAWWTLHTLNLRRDARRTEGNAA